jgi:predicted NBD/HSP70 family sugar kinase
MRPLHGRGGAREDVPLASILERAFGLPVAMDHHGPPCSCGGRGCVELFLSGSRLAALARGQLRSGAMRLDGVGPDEVDTETLGRAALPGHAGARDLVAQGDRLLMIGTAVFPPERSSLRRRDELRITLQPTNRLVNRME